MCIGYVFLDASSPKIECDSLKLLMVFKLSWLKIFDSDEGLRFCFTLFDWVANGRVEFRPQLKKMFVRRVYKITADNWTVSFGVVVWITVTRTGYRSIHRFVQSNCTELWERKLSRFHPQKRSLSIFLAKFELSYNFWRFLNQWFFTTISETIKNIYDLAPNPKLDC